MSAVYEDPRYKLFWEMEHREIVQLAPLEMMGVTEWALKVLCEQRFDNFIVTNIETGIICHIIFGFGNV